MTISPVSFLGAEVDMSKVRLLLHSSLSASESYYHNHVWKSVSQHPLNKFFSPSRVLRSIRGYASPFRICICGWIHSFTSIRLLSIDYSPPNPIVKSKKLSRRLDMIVHCQGPKLEEPNSRQQRLGQGDLSFGIAVTPLPTWGISH